MSMTSSQCDELRKAAQTYRGLGNHRAEQLLLDAADTISELRDRLTSDLPRLPHFWTHDGTLHIEAPKLPEGIAVTLPDERDREVRSARVWRYVREDESENARLREENERLRLFAKGDAIITDYWKDEDGTMHVLTTDGSSTYEYMRGGLAEENARLRDENAKLVKVLHEVESEAVDAYLGLQHDCELLVGELEERFRKYWHEQAENAKLRELCRRFTEYVSQDRCEGCVYKSRCNDGLIDVCWQRTEIHDMARELGIEVD